jgi:hypothetical protein
MPITIYDSDLAHARAERGELALRYADDDGLPMYYLLLRDAAGGELRLGPFEDEDSALAEAERVFGSLTWSAS